MENINCPTKFGESLDAYEKALARRNFEGALTSIEDAISHNPFPTLYAHLAACRDGVAGSLEAQRYAQTRKWYQPRRRLATA
jgi:hypothetical protein